MGNGKIFNTGMIKEYLLDTNEMGWRVEMGRGCCQIQVGLLNSRGVVFFAQQHEVTPSRTCHEVILHILAWTTCPTPFLEWQLRLNY